MSRGQLWGGGPQDPKFSESETRGVPQDPNKIDIFLRSELDLSANFPAPGHTSQTDTY